MTDKTIVLITGGNAGIGFESVKALYASPKAHTILLGSRSLEKAGQAIKMVQSEITESPSEIIPIQIDIEDDASIESCYKEVESKYGKLDVLVNNAGGSFDMILANKSDVSTIREVWNHDYSLNVTSTEVLTQTLVPLLLKSAQPRLLFVTSGLSSLTTCSSGRLSSNTARAPPISAGWPKSGPPSMVAYRSSKAALNMQMLEWTRLLKPDGVKVFGISPGFLATGLAGIGRDQMKEMGAGDPSLGGTFIKDVVEGTRDEDSGKVINSSGVQPW